MRNGRDREEKLQENCTAAGLAEREEIESRNAADKIKTSPHDGVSRDVNVDNTDYELGSGIQFEERNINGRLGRSADEFPERKWTEGT